MNGTLTLLPPSADVQLGVTNIDLRAIQPYVTEQIKLAITSGAVGVHGRAKYASPEPGAPLVNFTGDVAVTNFATVDDILFKDFVKLNALTVYGIYADLLPNKFHVDQVKFTGLDTVRDHGPAIIARICRPFSATKSPRARIKPAPETSAPATPAAKMPDLNAELGALVFENASLHVADQSIEPHCAFDVQEFGGTISGDLTTKEQVTATLISRARWTPARRSP